MCIPPMAPAGTLRESWCLAMSASERIDLAALRDRLAVLGIADSFFQSSVLFALARLRIFELIGESDKPLHELASQLDARPETLARLLNAGVVLNLLESQDGAIYRVAPLARSVLLPSAGQACLNDWIRTLSYFSAAMSDLIRPF